MSKIIDPSTEETSGVRVECPCEESCKYAIPEGEWNFKQVTDHFCPNGHLFRIEGTTTDEVLMYEIHPKITTKKNLV